MADPYFISDDSASQHRTAPEVTRTSILRTVTWLALVICAAGNVLISARGGSIAAHTALGAATLLCLVTLVVSHVRQSRAKQSKAGSNR
jgi:hypothetical protein